jgi:mannose-6-phosphate isomerase-like protein (cupin superfamily)
MMDKECNIQFSTIPWASPMKGVRHKVKPVGDKKLRLVEYTQEMEPHWCERGHTGYILDGQMEIEFEEGVHTFKAGDGVNIPNGPEHKHRAKVVSGVVRAFFIEDV